MIMISLGTLIASILNVAAMEVDLCAGVYNDSHWPYAIHMLLSGLHLCNNLEYV